jgi:hypothetical protein
MILTVIILLVLLTISLFYNYKFGMTLLRLEDVLEECLDVIDEKYSKMSEILSRPLFYDSPEVRKVVEDIRETRSSLHKVAIVLYKNFDAKGEEEKNATSR